MASRSEISSSRSVTQCASEESDALVAEVTPSGQRVGRSPWAAATKPRDGQSFEAALELVRGAEGQLAHLAERLDPGPSGRAFGHDEDPDRFDRTVPALGRSIGPLGLCRPGGLERVEGIGLAALWRA